MHTQHVKFSMYVAWGGGVDGVGGVVAVVLVGLVEEDDDRAVVEVVVVVVVSFLPSPSLPLVSSLVVLLDCIGTTEGLSLFCPAVGGQAPSLEASIELKIMPKCQMSVLLKLVC